MYSEDDYLQLSGIQHFAFCRRQWALIHIEQLWDENYLTAEGRLMHEKAHDPFFVEKRRDMIIARDMSVHSRELGISGKCDVIEFHRDDAHGIKLYGRDGAWLPFVVEYKRGLSKLDDCDRLQLAAQAMCLEEMLTCPAIEQSCIYYGETKRREYVSINEEMRETVRNIISEMHDYYHRRYTPRVKKTKICNRCSLNNLCLPNMRKRGNVLQYIEESLKTGVEL